MKKNICIKITKYNKIEEIKNCTRELKKEKIKMYLLGTIYKKYGKCTVNDIYKLYQLYGKNVYRYLDGVYTLIIVDYEIQK